MVSDELVRADMISEFPFPSNLGKECAVRHFYDNGDDMKDAVI